MFIMTMPNMQIFTVSSQSPAGFGHIAKTSFNSTCFVLQRKNKIKNNFAFVRMMKLAAAQTHVVLTADVIKSTTQVLNIAKYQISESKSAQNSLLV